MSVNGAGAASFFHHAAGVAPASRKPAETQEGDRAPALDAAKDQEEAQAKRAMTPEEQEKLKRALAGMASEEYRDILKDDARRDAEAREAQGLSPTGVVVNLSV